MRFFKHLRNLASMARAWFIPTRNKFVSVVFVFMVTVASILWAYQHSMTPQTDAANPPQSNMSLQELRDRVTENSNQIQDHEARIRNQDQRIAEINGKLDRILERLDDMKDRQQDDPPGNDWKWILTSIFTGAVTLERIHDRWNRKDE